MKEIKEEEFYKMLENENEIIISDICLKNIFIKNKRICSSVSINNCSFEHIVFENCSFAQFKFENCSFSHCEFLGIQIKDNEHVFDLTNCTFSSCFIHDLKIEAIGEESDIVRTSFYETRLSNMEFYVNVCIGQCNFVKCTLENNDIRVNEIDDNILEKLEIRNLKIRAGFSNNEIKNIKMQNCRFYMDEFCNWR